MDGGDALYHLKGNLGVAGFQRRRSRLDRISSVDCIIRRSEISRKDSDLTVERPLVFFFLSFLAFVVGVGLRQIDGLVLN
jgi:hypothetical protein